MSMRVVGLRANGLINPLGIDCPYPELSWCVEGTGSAWQQSAYIIQVALDEHFSQFVWESGRVASTDPFGCRYMGDVLESRRRYYWRVEILGAAGESAGWSEPAWFETAILEEDQFRAEWIGFAEEQADDFSTLYLRKVLELSAPVVRGRAYVSALGWYKLFVNLQDLTGNSLVPRWTPLDHVVEYQTFDVTHCFTQGKNVIAMAVGDGRYRGKLGATSRRAVYGNRLAGFAQFVLELADGAQVEICSDASWEAGRGRITRADPQDGEKADLRIQDLAWLASHQHLSGFHPAASVSASRRLIAEEVGRVKEVARLRPITIKRSRSGKQIVDFGQNFAGIVRIRLAGASGAQLRLTYSELLDKNGELDTAYLKLPLFPAVLQRDEVILAGTPQWYQPWFTSHGFRYLEVDGPIPDLDLEDIEGIVLSSQLEETGTFDCSEPALNRLHCNVQWSMRANFVDTPTDCPTRERSGWTGDIQVFADTAAKLSNVQTYLRRFLRNLAIEQLPDGRVPPFIPSETSSFSGGMPRLEFIHAGSAGWGDVSILLPWSIYRSYGDRQVLEEQYPSMQRWLSFLVRGAERGRGRGRWCAKSIGKLERYIVDGGFHWGEWLRPGDSIPQILRAWFIPEARVATAYLANSARVLAEIAGLLGYADDAVRYKDLATNTREAWRAAFLCADGHIGKDRQDDYVRALAFGLLEPHEQSAAVARLVELIKANDYHLDTGFLSTPMLLPTLARFGRSDIAYRLLLQTTDPSWLGQIGRGATTVWETWEGHRPDGSAKMSHNHYAFGAVVNWLYEGIAGISPAEPGYRRIRFAPCIGGNLQHAAASIQTPFGRASSAWRIEGTEVRLDISVPIGSTADVHLGNGVIKEVGSGEHCFYWGHQR